MLSAFLGQITSFFDKRFLFNVWFPSLLFGAAGVVVAAIAMGPQAAVDAWSAMPALTQAWLGAGGLVLVTFFAYICDNLLGTMVRFYEGYWPEWAQWLRRIRVGVRQRRWQHLNDRLDLADTQRWNLTTAIEKADQKPTAEQTLVPDETELQKCMDQFQKHLGRIPRLKEERRAGELVDLFHQLQALRSAILKQCQRGSLQQAEWKDKAVHLGEAFIERCRKEEARLEGEYNRLYAVLYQSFPQDPARLMPTQLGNVLRAAEEYSQLTYNFDAPTVWPRLVQQLPAEFKAQLEQSSTPLTTMLFSATLSFLFAVTGGVLLFSLGNQWLLFLGTVVGGLLLSAWCYEGAVHRAVEYGMLIRTAFDLYRHELLKALGVPLPSSPLEEWKLWPQLMKWWYFHTPPFDAAAGKSAWYYEGKRPAPGGPKRDEHVLYLKFGVPPKEKEGEK
jgi:hypothetical protein